jgi:cytoskeletal protein CcmA (bactofilin family)
VWNKRREEEPPKPFAPAPPRPAPAAPSQVEYKENAPVSSMSSGRIDDPRPGAATVGKSVKVVGQIFSKEDLYVDGEVEGTIEAPENKLIIGPNGAVHAGIKAREVVALGSIQGNVEAIDKIEIRKDARLVGDIRTARIIIEDGAYFKGSIDIVKPEPAKSAPRPAPAVASPPAQAASPAATAAPGEAKR